MKHVSAIICIMLLASCASNDPYKKINKLSGLWKMDTDEGPLYEEWTKQQGNSMFGKSYMINGTDSMVFERVELAKKDSGVYYIPTVRDQNENKPTYFKMISSSDSSFIFENKLHDFPQRVIYRFVNKDSLVARIEGDKNGQLQFQEYFYSKIK